MIKLLTGAAILLSTSSVFAAVTPSLIGLPIFNPATNDYTYNYNVQIATDQTANTGPVPGTTTSAGVNVPTGGSAAYFTIYDFSGFVGGSNTQPGGWAFKSSNTGSSPSDVNPVDNPGNINLTWYVSSGSLVGPQNISGFSARSTLGTPTSVQFTGQATRNTGSFNGTDISNIGSTGGPSGSVTAVPEPAAYALLGGGLLAFGLLRRRS